MTRRVPAWRRYLRFWRPSVPDDVGVEIQFHLDMRTREYVARGMDETSARAAAARRLGDISAATDACIDIGRANERRARQADFVDSARSDIRFAIRSFARTPGWTAVALVTMALGVGASTAVLSVVDGLLIHPIAYPFANRIATVRLDIPFGPGQHAWAAPTPSTIEAWRQSARSIEAIEGYGKRDVSLDRARDAEPIHAALIGPRFLSFAGATPIVGHSFSTDDGLSVVMLSEPYWTRELGSARDVVGKVIRANGQALTIIGVLPASLRLPDLSTDPVELWLPLAPTSDQRLAGVVARLRPGVTTVAAEAELETIARRLGDDRFSAGARVELMRPSETLKFRRALQMVAGAVALLLLVACANLSHLSLARGTARERELAVRFALGAGRARLVRQLLTESLFLSAVGGVLAAALGAGALALLRAVHPPTLAALGTVAVDRSVFTIAAALTTVASVAIGLLVALRVARNGITDSLRVGGGDRRGGTRIRSALVVSEIALSATLLVSALLLVRGVIDLQSAASGVDTRGLYAMAIPLRGSAFESGAGRMELARRLRERVRSLPGVAGVTVAEAAPFKTPFYFGSFETPDHPGDPANPTTSTTNTVSADYFSVLGISMLAGHTFDAGSADRNEVVIDEVLAKQLWPRESSIGKRFRIASGGPGDPPGQWWTVIGVTRNVLAHGLLDGAPSAAVYSPLGPSFERGRLTVIARWKDGSAPAASLSRLGAELAPNGPPTTVTNLSQYLSDSIAEPRFAMQVLASFALLAVVLAAIGLYGVVAYSVTQRTREIGIRMTLGATRRVIARLVVGNGLRLSCAGIALGLAGAVAATRAITAALYGVGQPNVLSFVLGAAGLLMVSVLACAIPVVRATAVDPAIAVRAD